MNLTETEKNFILHWGEMGTRWGINRTVAQIYALLYLSPKPLHAEEICETLNLARSTVSTGLHELQTWSIVNIVHVLGDRRDHFEALDDVWGMFRQVVDERKRRELDPTLRVLRQTLASISQNGDAQNPTGEKLARMLDFFETIDRLYGQIQSLSTDTLIRISKMGDAISFLVSKLN
jgi:DNA-binding transcriptional regulator GbsR (MarR family)